VAYRNVVACFARLKMKSLCEKFHAQRLKFQALDLVPILDAFPGRNIVKISRWFAAHSFPSMTTICASLTKVLSQLSCWIGAGRQRKMAMLGLLILLFVFGGGFAAGYVVRHYVSRRRRERYLKGSVYKGSYIRPGPAIGQPKRAF
jgi:hypothetical protein